MPKIAVYAFVKAWAALHQKLKKFFHEASPTFRNKYIPNRFGECSIHKINKKVKRKEPNRLARQCNCNGSFEKMENKKKRIKCEIYRDIKGYEGFYQISNYGNVKSLRNNKLLIQTNHKGGYKLVSVSVDGMHRELTVHRLVAQAFIPNPNNYRDVNHKDGNKANNHVDNLEWVTHSDNIKHSYNSLNQRRNDVAVVCIETGVKYQSCKVASELTGINKSSINHAINGVARKAGGYTWARS